MFVSNNFELFLLLIRMKWLDVIKVMRTHRSFNIFRLTITLQYFQGLYHYAVHFRLFEFFNLDSQIHHVLIILLWPITMVISSCHKYLLAFSCWENVPVHNIPYLVILQASFYLTGHPCISIVTYWCLSAISPSISSITRVEWLPLKKVATHDDGI